MGARTAFGLAVIAAVAMLVIAALMTITAPPCHPLPMSTLTAFELVRTDADLERIFGLPGDACRAALMPQLDHANLIDTVAYIPAYAAFYALVLYALGRRDRLIGWFGVALVIVCAATDWLENYSMFGLASFLQVESASAGMLVMATNLKWVGLGLATTLGGVMLVRRGGLGWIGLLGIAPLVTSLWAVAAPDAAGQYLITGMTIASVMLLLVAIVGAIRKEPVELAVT